MATLEYFQQSDRWRTKYANGEADWHQMMANRKPIDQAEFLSRVDIETAPFLDDDETLDDFTSDDPESGYYASTVHEQDLCFVQTSGFEFIFTLDGENVQTADVSTS